MYARQLSQETEEKINSLGKRRKAVSRGWQEKGDWLRQVRDLQLVNQSSTSLNLTFRESWSRYQRKSTERLEEEVNNHSGVVDKLVESGKKLFSGL